LRIDKAEVRITKIDASRNDKTPRGASNKANRPRERTIDVECEKI